MTAKLKWKCGCGAKFRTKKECEQHIKDEHWDIISHSAGLATLRYKPTKIPPEDAPEPKKPPGSMSSSAAAWLTSVANESPSKATRGKAREVLADTAPTTAEYRKKAWDAKERGQWAKAAKYYALALKHYPPHQPGSQIAIADKAGLQRLLDEMQWEAQTAATPKPPAGSGLQMQSSFEGGGGQTHFAGGSPKKKGKKTAKKTAKKKEKKGSGSLAAFGVMPEGQKTLEEMAAELMR